MALPGRCSYGDLGALCEFERLIDNLFRRDGAPRSVFLWRLGSNMFRIIGHTSCHRAGFSKHIAPKFFCPPLTCGLCESCGDGFRRCHDRRRTTSGTAAGIYDLRRLKIKHCAEPVEEARSALDFCLSITQNIQVTQNRSRGSKRESRHGNCRHLL